MNGKKLRRDRGGWFSMITQSFKAYLLMMSESGGSGGDGGGGVVVREHGGGRIVSHRWGCPSKRLGWIGNMTGESSCCVHRKRWILVVARRRKGSLLHMERLRKLGWRSRRHDGWTWIIGIPATIAAARLPPGTLWMVADVVHTGVVGVSVGVGVGVIREERREKRRKKRHHPGELGRTGKIKSHINQRPASQFIR